MAYEAIHGSVRVTADSVVGRSGSPLRVFSVTWLSGAAGGELVLRNGTDATGTIYVQQDGTAGKTVVQSWDEGLLFPNGCFFDKDANVTAAVIECRNELI